jgi:type VI secretion system protein ImpK
MLKAMYGVCADVLALGTLVAGATDLPAPTELHQKIAGLFEEMMTRAELAAIPKEDVAEARYALVAFLDEQLLRARWPGRDVWLTQPLQLVYFNENTAGEGFFTRMRRISEQPERVHVLLIYYLCISLGFRGRFAVGGEQGLEAILDDALLKLRAVSKTVPGLSPRGDAPDRGPVPQRPERKILAAGLGAAAVALFVMAALQLDLVVRVVRTGHALDEVRYAPPAPSAR